MAWVKIPAEHHPVFLVALPKDRRVATLKMFGAVCGTVNGNMFAGLFGRSFMVKLSDADHKEALSLDGAEPFDPMGTGRVMGNSVFMPEDVFGDDAELKAWVRRAFDYAATLPPKKKKGKTAKPKAKVAAKPKPKPKAKAKARTTTARPRR
jgi:TfoX/Sxy family transcriptional regulator of competence genes